MSTIDLRSYVNRYGKPYIDQKIKKQIGVVQQDEFATVRDAYDAGISKFKVQGALKEMPPHNAFEVNTRFFNYKEIPNSQPEPWVYKIDFNKSDPRANSSMYPRQSWIPTTIDERANNVFKDGVPKYPTGGEMLGLSTLTDEQKKNVELSLRDPEAVKTNTLLEQLINLARGDRGGDGGDGGSERRSSLGSNPETMIEMEEEFEQEEEEIELEEIDYDNLNLVEMVDMAKNKLVEYRDSGQMDDDEFEQLVERLNDMGTRGDRDNIQVMLERLIRGPPPEEAPEEGPFTYDMDRLTPNKIVPLVDGYNKDQKEYLKKLADDQYKGSTDDFIFYFKNNHNELKQEDLTVLRDFVRAIKIDRVPANSDEATKKLYREEMVKKWVMYGLVLYKIETGNFMDDETWDEELYEPLYRKIVNENKGVSYSDIITEVNKIINKK
jgi:hypothetical protein